MKKLISNLLLSFVAIVSSSIVSIANETNIPPQEVSNEEINFVKIGTIYYQGPAWSMTGGLDMEADQSVEVDWTSEGCFVNGTEVATPTRIVPNGIMMWFPDRRKTILMNYYVTYRGEKYYFSI